MADDDEAKKAAFRGAVEAICVKLWGKDVLDREIICTPCDGAYGLAWWVVAVNGSPPRGTLVLSENQISPDPSFASVFLIADDDFCRKLRGRSAKRLLVAAHALFGDKRHSLSPVTIPAKRN